MKPPEGFPHFAALDGDNFYIYWKYDELSITFHLVAKTTGWVGFGLSPDGEMENSDVVIGWVDNDRVQFSVSRCISTSFSPFGITSQDWHE